MLMLGMLFGVLVLGPVLVLGALALANNERAMARLGGLRRHASAPADEGSSAGDKPETHDGDDAAADVTAMADGAGAP